MTPAVLSAKKAKIKYSLHEYEHDPNSDSYGEEAAMLLQQETAQVFKTLLVSLNGDPKNLAVAILPVSHKLNLKAFAHLLKAKKAVMADPQHAQNATGYLLGGISPLGQKKRLPMIVNDTALGFDYIFVSGGKRGLEIQLSAEDLISITAAKAGNIVA